MAQGIDQTIYRDPALLYWVLIPITLVMILTGVLRHYLTVFLSPSPKQQPARTVRETTSLARGLSLRTHAYNLSPRSFAQRKAFFTHAYSTGYFLKDANDPKVAGNAKNPQAAAPPNPLSDPAAMDQMMGAMKGNMAMMIPQTLIMSWINAFFSGFVILKLPFPLTVRFKQMLQSGVATRDLHVRWVSSLSWYFLCLFGLQSVFVFLLADGNAAAAAAQTFQPVAMAGAAGGMPGMPGQDMNKVFRGEGENLEVLPFWSVLDGVERRLLDRLEG